MFYFSEATGDKEGGVGHAESRGQTCNVYEVTEAVQTRRAKVNLKNSLPVFYKLKLEKYYQPACTVQYITVQYLCFLAVFYI